MTYKSQFNKLTLLALAMLLSVEGCVWGSVQYDRTLEKEKIKDIRSGTTTRTNIMEWFGPPEVLARTNSKVPLPSLEPDRGKIREVDSKIFFKYFLDKHTISEQHVVYYYFNEGEDINGFAIPIPLGITFVNLPATFGILHFSELWVLVNRETGQVEDYVFLEGEEK